MEAKDFRVIKSEIRVLGVDDGKFVPHTQGNVNVIGVVFRGGCWLDGLMHTTISIDGFDATEQIASMINSSPHCKQLRLVMLNGITFGGFNVVDLKRLNSATKLPIIALTRGKPDLEAIHNAINNLPKPKERWKMILAAGKIQEIHCRGAKIYAELTGISETDAREVVELTSTRSSFPEPLRVAHLVASGTTWSIPSWQKFKRYNAKGIPKTDWSNSYMEFCPKCGSRLEPKKSKSGKDASLVLACPKCGYKKSEVGEKVEPKVIQHSPQQFVAVIGKEEQKLSTLPTVRIECPRCGNNTAYVWQVQTRGADESSTQFLRCTKCNYTFREYS